MVVLLNGRGLAGGDRAPEGGFSAAVMSWGSELFRADHPS